MQASNTSAGYLSFWEFFSQCYVPFNKLELPLKPLHKGCCEALERAVLGQLHKSFVVVNIPPRVGKTKMMEALTCWMLAYFPDAQCIFTSYANVLVQKSIRYIQEVMKSDWYEELFETRLGKVQQADHFETAQGGTVYGDGVGGGLTGFGAGLKRKAGGFIVIDDPSKPDEALSKVESDKLRFWFENTILSRRNSSQWTPIIICMQRLDTEDLSGFVLDNYPDDVEHIKFSARLPNGESAIPETKTTESLLASERVNPYAFAAQYLQEPAIIGGNLIKTENWRYYDPESPPKFEIKIIVADTATKAKTANDHSVIQCWGRSQHRAFLIDQMRGKWEPAQLLRNLRQFYAKHNTAKGAVAYVAIEEAGAGFMLIQELRKKGIPAKGIIPLSDKVSRVSEVLAFQETGMVYLPRDAQWLAAFELELAQFRRDGKSPRDDQVDTWAHSLKLMLGKGTSILAVLGKERRDVKPATPVLADAKEFVQAVMADPAAGPWVPPVPKPYECEVMLWSNELAIVEKVDSQLQAGGLRLRRDATGVFDFTREGLAILVAPTDLFDLPDSIRKIVRKAA